MAKRETKTPSWLVERLAAGDLDAEAASAVRRRLAAEGRSADDEIAALARSSQEILDAHPPAAVAAEVRRRARPLVRPVRARRPRTLLFGGALVAAGALALVLLPRPSPKTSVDDGAYVDGVLEPTTIKGLLTRLHVYRHHAAGDLLLHDGETAARGDLLQLAYLAPNPVFGVLLSIDGAGHVTQHWPEHYSGPHAPALRMGGEVRLPSAYELDDAPGFERFFLIASDRPFEVAPVLEAARALAAQPVAARRASLPLAPGLRQTSLALDKPQRAPSPKTQETP